MVFCIPESFQIQFGLVLSLVLGLGQVSLTVLKMGFKSHHLMALVLQRA